nr:DUF637 domain-containing protein [Pseudomonas sp. KNUC1026]
MNGEQVLVPVVYLAQANGRLGPNGALIAGNDVSLIAGKDLTNVGTLKASNNLSAKAAGDLTNSGLIQAGGSLDLLAGNTIVNKAGGIIAGRDVSATAINGDVINERTLTTHQSSAGTKTEQRGFADSAARIEAANDLAISAGRDISNTGGVLQSGRDLALRAGRDVNVDATQVNNSLYLDSNRNSSDITQLGARATAGRDLSIQAGRDVSLVASQLEAKRDVAVAAGENLLVSAAADESHLYAKTKKVTAQEDHVSQVSTTITSGGNLDLSAGQDMTVTASNLTAANEAYLVAGGKLNLLAAQDSDYSLYDMKKKGGFGSKKTQRDEVTDVTNVGSQVKAGGDITLASGGDQTYQGARLETAKDLTIDSGGAVTFEAVKDLHQESHEKSSNSAVWNSMSGKGRTDETVRQTEMAVQGELMIQAAQRITVDVKEVNQQSVHQTIDAMVAVNPDLAWLKDAEARGDVDWRQVKEVHDSYKYSHSGLGGAAQLVIAIIIAYFTAGAASGLVAGAASSAGASVTAGSAWAASTAATATTAGAAAGWANAAASAVLVGMASNAGIGFINNGGDLGLTLKQVVSKDALKGYAVSGITAGLTAGLYDEWTSTQTGQSAVEGAAKTSSTSNALSNTAAVTAKNGLSTWSGIGQFAASQTLQNSTSALLNKALGQKGSLGDALQQSLVNTFVAAGFNLVGDIGRDYGFDDGKAAKIGLHALMGGLAAEAMGGDFKTGALAAGVNEAIVKSLSDAYSGMAPEDKKRLLVMNSQLIGVLSASLQGGDQKSVEVASAVNASATQYNFLRLCT